MEIACFTWKAAISPPSARSQRKNLPRPEPLQYRCWSAKPRQSNRSPPPSVGNGGRSLRDLQIYQRFFCEAFRASSTNARRMQSSTHVDVFAPSLKVQYHAASNTIVRALGDLASRGMTPLYSRCREQPVLRSNIFERCTASASPAYVEVALTEIGKLWRQKQRRCCRSHRQQSMSITMRTQRCAH